MSGTLLVATAGQGVVKGADNGQTVWKVAIDPVNPERMFIGTGAPSLRCCGVPPIAVKLGAYRLSFAMGFQLGYSQHQ